jgi:lactate 2-monooxygenase
MRTTAVEWMRQIYTNGFKGKTLSVPASFNELEKAAKENMSKEGFAYVAGGAGSEQTMANNRKALDEVRILPRMLKDVSQRDLSTELLGQQLPAPVLLAPIGVLDLAVKEGDLHLARAAAELGLPMIFSNQASLPMEACAREMGDSPRWFQLYWSKSDELVQSFLQRAENCGCSALVVTLDTTMLGWRPRDLNLGYLPFLHAKGLGQYLSDPVFQQLVEERMDKGDLPPSGGVTLQAILSLVRLSSKYPGGSFWQKFKSKKGLYGVRTFTDTYTRPSLNWEDIKRLRKWNRLPIILKGILHPDDARQAIDLGVDGIIVSNHGGRQVDGSIAAFEALPGVAEVVGDQLPILMDSGIRSGADVFKALAMGASAVCIGRPYVYALALGGEAGVKALLQHFLSELELTMGLTGCSKVQEINKEMIKR